MKTPVYGRLSVYLALNFLLSLLFSTFYLFFAGSNPLGLFFAGSALISNTFMFYAALSLFGLAVFWLKPARFVFTGLITVFQLALVTDAAIYKIFKMHINPMVLNLILTPGGLNSLDQGFWMKALFFAILLGLIALEAWFYRLSGKAARKDLAGPGFIKKRLASVLGVLLFFLLLDKLLFAWGSAYDIVNITRNAKLFPLYQPFTARTFIQKHFHTRLDKPVSFKLDVKSSRLDYPKKPLEFAPADKPNIVYIVIDSFRGDMMNPEVTPELWAFSKKAVVFKNHYSGGNCTRFGIFSLIYGLYGSYWFQFVAERKPPVMIQALEELGYDFRLYAGVKLSFPEFDRTCFVDIPHSKVYDEPAAEGKSDKDAEITGKFIEFARNRDKKKPYFAFIFYDASHGTYEYPPEYERFKPAASSFSYLTVEKKKVLPIFNKYKNSIYYDSSLAMKIINALSAGGGLKNTAVIVTGDHGEPFFEHGLYGHNHGYPPEEIKVPLVFYWPGLKPRSYEDFSSHFDVAPGVLKLLGAKNPPSDYSSGTDLFKPEARDFLAAFSWDTAAIVKKTGTLTMALEAYRLGGVKVFDADYREVAGKKAEAAFTGDLLSFQKEAVRFYK
ncbi:MAG: sulfatase-like hydrolase/transferase [Elusimicrobia bacterium]|nr:sulfatase-like hydrolase/transferase [Elusimicrobiota bacterium]